MTQLFKSVIVVVLAMLFVLVANALVFLFLARAGHAESIEYDVTGINTATGERVAGTMVDAAHDGTVHGLIHDRLDRVPVGGRWSGRGMARMSDGGVRTYKVEVVE